MISLASAFEWDNVQFERDITFDDRLVEGNSLLEIYPPIEIINALGFGDTLFEGYLSQHDNVCGENCKSTMEIKLYEDSVLIDDIIFKTWQEDDEWIEQDVRGYHFKYWGDISDYELQCNYTNIADNGSVIKECEDVLVGSYEGWKDYSLGEKVDAGEYKVKLIGQKKPSRSVDWVIKTNGEWLNNWATWGNISLGDDAEVILNFPPNNSVSLTTNVTFNCSANITGGSTLTNISLYHNVTGSWLNNETITVIGGMVDSNIQFKFNGNLSNTGNVSINTTETGTVVYEVGKINQSYDPSVGNYFEIDDTPVTDFGTGSFSMSFWFNNSDDSFYVMDEESNQQGIRVTATGNGGIRLTLEMVIVLDTLGFGGADITDGNWHNVVYVRDTSNLSVFVDGNWTNSTTDNTSVDTGAMIMGIISAGNGAAVDGLDDFRLFKNVVLTQEEINQLYNSGSGTEDMLTKGNVTSTTQTFEKNITSSTLWSCEACDSDGDCGFASTNRTVFLDVDGPTFNVQSPTGILDYNAVGDPETLNVTFTDGNLDVCWFDYNGTNVTIVGCVNATKNSTTFTLDLNNTNMTIYANDTLSNLNSTFVDWDYRVLEINTTFNPTSFETANETFSINLTANSSLTNVRLIYAGATFSATSSGSVYSTSIDIPTGVGNNSFHWNFTHAGSQIESRSFNQTISATDYGLCNATLTVPFINYSFRDETNLSNINATFNYLMAYGIASSSVSKNLVFQNTSENPNYTFCFIPSTETLEITGQIQYGGATYPSRIFEVIAQQLTNSTSQQILYLLDTNEGFFTRYQAINSLTGEAISDVVVVVQKSIAGVPTTIEQISTDATGTVTFWLDPDDLHSYTFTREGFQVTSFTIRPSSPDTYPILMIPSGIIGNETFNGTEIFTELDFTISPTNITLLPNTSVTFSFSVSRTPAVDSFSMVISNNNTTLFNQSNSGNGQISTSINTFVNSSFFGNFTINLGNETINFLRTWTITNIYEGDFSLQAWMNFPVERNFDSVWWGIIRYLVVLTLLIGIAGGFYYTDPFDSSVASLIAAIIVVWAIGSFGWLTIGTPLGDSVDKNAIASLFTIITVAFMAWRYKTQ